MGDTTERNAVLKRFEEPGYDPVAWIQRQRMADHIVELEAIIKNLNRSIATLRRPSEAVVRAVEEWVGYDTKNFAQNIIHAAVEAAEQEADRD